MKCATYNCECKYAMISPRDIHYCRGINYLKDSGAKDRAIECEIKTKYNVSFKMLWQSHKTKNI